MTHSPSRKQAAVLVALFRDSQAEPRVVLVVRGAWGVHGDQLGFPGGKAEARDASPLQTALREAEEEIALAPDDVEVIASLAPIDTKTTGFRVHPYVARIRPPTTWHPAPGEITAVVTPRVSDLADPALRENRWLTAATWPKARFVETVSLEGGHIVWGLTLRLLDLVLPRLLGQEWTI